MIVPVNTKKKNDKKKTFLILLEKNAFEISIKII